MEKKEGRLLSVVLDLLPSLVSSFMHLTGKRDIDELKEQIDDLEEEMEIRERKLKRIILGLIVWNAILTLLLYWNTIHG